MGWLSNKLTDFLRLWHRDGLPERLAFGEIEDRRETREAMARAAAPTFSLEAPIGVFGVIGVEYAGRAVRAWRPKERLLMEDVSCAFRPVQARAGSGHPVPQPDVDRLVFLLGRYLAYVGSPWPDERLRAAVARFIRDSAPREEPNPPPPAAPPRGFSPVAEPSSARATAAAAGAVNSVLRRPRGGGVGDAGFELLRHGPLTRFADAKVMAEEVRDLEADGYRCVAVDCSAWEGEADFHTAVASALAFPADYGRNPEAFEDGLKSIRPSGSRNLVLAFWHWEIFAGLAWPHARAVLDAIASASRFRLLYGDRLLALLHVADPELQFEPVGGVDIVPSERESRREAGDLLTSVLSGEPETEAGRATDPVT